MRLTIEVEIDNLLEATTAHAWWVNGAKDDPRTGQVSEYEKAEALKADLEREAKFRAEQYLRNITTIWETRPR